MMEWRLSEISTLPFNQARSSALPASPETARALFWKRCVVSARSSPARSGARRAGATDKSCIREAPHVQPAGGAAQECCRGPHDGRREPRLANIRSPAVGQRRLALTSSDATASERSDRPLPHQDAVTFGSDRYTLGRQHPANRYWPENFPAMWEFSSSLILAPGSTSRRRMRSTRKSWTSATAGWRCSSFPRTSTRSWSLRIAWSSCQGDALPTPHQSRTPIARQSDIIWPARRRQRLVSDLAERRRGALVVLANGAFASGSAAHHFASDRSRADIAGPAAISGRS